MAPRMREIVQHLRQVMLQQDGAGLTDEQLLDCFLDRRDEAAAAALVRRHGPMVWGVCRRILRNQHDAEDAFQATFLVFVRRAAVIAPRAMVGNWLYGVAYQTALKARATLAKRRAREKQVPSLPEIEGDAQPIGHDVRLILDQELSRLPNKYRVAIVLCDLEGKTRTEAARQLGVPPGTLASRLTRGRALLAKRLARHGLAVSGGMLTMVLAEQGASACLPPSLMSSTIKTVTSMAAGQAATTGLISAQAAALTEGMVKTMMLTKLKFATGVMLMLTATAASGWFYQTQAGGRTEEAPPVEQKKEDELRAAAIKAVEQFGKSEQANDRETAIKALVDYRKATEEARQRLESASRYLASRFKYRVPFEIGDSEFRDGCRIEIREVWGTRPRIEMFGQYLVRGKYTLASHNRGSLYFYLTANKGMGWSSPLDLQRTDVREGQGEFTLIHGMAESGFFHVQLLNEASKIVANVYFGTGDNVLRSKKDEVRPAQPLGR